MRWLDFHQLEPGLWVFILLFVTASMVLFIHLARVRKRLGRLYEELDTNNAKLRALFARAHEINSSNGNALKRK